MYLAELELTDFRSYPRLSLSLGPGSTVFLGPNGQGKTNLLEAVGYVATLGSHRVATDAPLVFSGAERAVVRATVVRAGRPATVEVEIAVGRANRARLNRSPVRRVADVLGTLRTVLFAPEDLSLVKGDPAGRRQFVDGFLSALAPRWAGVRADLDRVIRQRTALLRSAAGLARGGRRADLRTLDAWDEQLIVLGAELTAARLGAVERLSPHVRSSYEVLSGGGQATLQYTSSVVAVATGDAGAPRALEQLRLAGAAVAVPGRAGLEVALRSELARRRPDELARGQCLVGPHRDDLALGVGELPAKGYASHGESWSVALALRLASFGVLREADETGDPVLLLDDVFAELDERRRDRLAGLVADAEQVLVTAAVAGDVPAQLRESAGDTPAGAARLFRVGSGQVTHAA